MIYILFLIGLVTLIFKTIYELITKIRASIRTKTLEIEWYSYIDMIVILVTFISVIYWIQLFLVDR